MTPSEWESIAGFYGRSFPHIYDLSPGDGKWIEGTEIMLISEIPDKVLIKLLRMLRKTRYFKLPELIDEAKRRRLHWKYRFLGRYWLY